MLATDLRNFLNRRKSTADFTTAVASLSEARLTVSCRTGHARNTAAAAARAGLACELAPAQSAPRLSEAGITNGGVLVDELLGAAIRDLSGATNEMLQDEPRGRTRGKRASSVYLFPRRFSATGCLGYAACASEIEFQSTAQGTQFDEILIPNGSGGMHAGLVAGFVALE